MELLQRLLPDLMMKSMVKLRVFCLALRAHKFGVLLLEGSRCFQLLGVKPVCQFISG